MTDREAQLQRCGRAYGAHRLAVAFTDAIAGDAAKRISRKGWNETPRLADAAFGAGLLSGRGRSRNPAIVLGASGLIGIDVDGEEGARLLRELHPERLPSTVTVSTGKGWHLWFRRPAGVTDVAKIELGPEGLKIAKDGYLVAPPALHPSGCSYTFAMGRAPWETEIELLNVQHLKPFLEAHTASRSKEIASTGPILVGGRHRHLFRVGCAMRRVGAIEPSILSALLVENAHRCTPPEDEDVVRALAHDIVDRYSPSVTA